jgi:hypothetical protein
MAPRARLVVVENLISYDGAQWMFCSICSSSQATASARERIYVMDGWEAAEWRAPWREDALVVRRYPGP